MTTAFEPQIAQQPTQDEIARSKFMCCDAGRALTASERAAAEYTGWTGIYPWPTCSRCGGRMFVIVTQREQTPPKAEPKTHIMTRTEMLAAREHAKRVAAISTETPPHEALMPFGDYGGKKMCDVPNHELEKARVYFTSSRRRDRSRAKEIVDCIDAALAWKKARPETEFPRALIDASDDGLPF